MIEADFLLRNCAELVTATGHEPARGAAARHPLRIPNAAVAAREGQLVAVGPESELKANVRLLPGGVELDAGGRSVLPGFVDPHTHAVFGKARASEYAARLEGRSYTEIAAAGGGIHSSVRDLRRLDLDALLEATLPRLHRMLAHGTTTVEIKTGYGLDFENEMKTLRCIEALRPRVPQTLIATFLGAHEIPLEFRANRAQYVRTLVEEMIPAAAPYAEFNDVFCEPSVFTHEETTTILTAGKAHGLAAKVHADELAPYGTTELACRLAAVSADHLLYVSEEGIRALAGSPTVAVLLPGTSFGLASGRWAPARRLWDGGAAVAIATDFNPGSSYSESMQSAWSLACSMLRMTPGEGLVAATLNAAAAVGRAGNLGTLEAGKRCDLVVLHCDDYREVPYHFGVNNVRTVVAGGRVVWTDPDVAPREAD